MMQLFDCIHAACGAAACHCYSPHHVQYQAPAAGQGGAAPLVPRFINKPYWDNDSVEDVPINGQMDFTQVIRKVLSHNTRPEDIVV